MREAGTVKTGEHQKTEACAKYDASQAITASHQFVMLTTGRRKNLAETKRFFVESASVNNPGLRSMNLQFLMCSYTDSWPSVTQLLITSIGLQVSRDRRYLVGWLYHSTINRVMLRFRLRGASLPKVPAGQLLLEMLSVVIGVLLALGAAAWKENRDNQHIADAAKAKIIAEVQQTLIEVSDDIELNGVRLDTLNAVQGRVQAAGNVWTEPNRLSLGFSYSILSQTAWEAAKVTDAIQHMDPEFVDLASVVYGMVDLYLLHAHNLIAQRGTVAYNATGQEIAQVRAHSFNLTFLNVIGQNYVQLAQNFLETHDPTYEPPTPDEENP